MIKNIKAIDRVSQSLIQVDRRYKARNTMITLMLRSAISRNLSQAIGEKSKHFVIQVIPAGTYMVVTLRPKDAVGSYIYKGTKAHSISSSEPMPIGNGRFSRNVSHPGTASERERINNAVRKSMVEVKMIMKVMR